MTTLAVSDKCIPEWLSKSCSLQDWGLVYWETAWLSGVKSGVLCHSSSVLLCTRSALESKSHQQLDRRLAATVWAARHHSNAPLTFTSAAWIKNHTSAPAPGDTDWNWNEGICLSETGEVCQWAEMASDWNIISNQQCFIDQSIDQWRDRFIACLKAKSKYFEHLLWRFLYDM